MKGRNDFPSGGGKNEIPFNKMEKLSLVSHEESNRTKAHASNLAVQEEFIPIDCLLSPNDSALSSTSWFHGKISREEAEVLLLPREDGLFLVRESTNFPGDYTLCVCFQEKVEHYRVIKKNKKLTIDEEEFFDTLDSLIEHYEQDADGLCTKLKLSVPKAHKRNYLEQLEQTFVSDGWVIDIKELGIKDSIGKGEFGEVLLADWNGENVAVKKLRDVAAQSLVEEAFHMTKMKHKNLVALRGVVLDQSSIYLVTEFMSKGSLLDYLRSRGRILICKKTQIRFACDIANGMTFLESKEFVHRDLAARNVLLHEDGTAKVSDFGLTLKMSHTTKISPDFDGGKFPIKWTAPEALKQNKFSNKSDMWSFGILLWEIYSFGRVPYPRIPLAEVMKYIESGSRMEKPDDCPDEIYRIMREGWEISTDDRPTFKDVFNRLERIKQLTIV